MSEIEKMQKYIAQTGISKEDAEICDMTAREWIAIHNEKAPMEAIAFAFDYGCAKGYRAAKAEVRA